ncbi:hypothetical protein vseg_001805 [Gypsophila vaccaria]
MENFTRDQRESIIEIGFGGLLELKIKKIPSGLMRWLIDAFSPMTHMLNVSNSKKNLISKYDVHDIILLPKEGRKVEKIVTDHCKPTSDDHLNKSGERNMILEEPIKVLS